VHRPVPRQRASTECLGHTPVGGRYQSAAEENIVSDQELRRRLEELHRELSEVGEVDADLERLLAEVRTDIENVMDRPDPNSISGLLSEAVERFEASHPRLASAMGAVIDQLARIGV